MVRPEVNIERRRRAKHGRRLPKAFEFVPHPAFRGTLAGRWIECYGAPSEGLMGADIAGSCRGSAACEPAADVDEGIGVGHRIEAHLTRVRHVWPAR